MFSCSPKEFRWVIFSQLWGSAARVARSRALVKQKQAYVKKYFWITCKLLRTSAELCKPMHILGWGVAATKKPEPEGPGFQLVVCPDKIRFARGYP